MNLDLSSLLGGGAAVPDALGGLGAAPLPADTAPDAAALLDMTFADALAAVGEALAETPAPRGEGPPLDEAVPFDEAAPRQRVPLDRAHLVTVDPVALAEAWLIAPVAQARVAESSIAVDAMDEVIIWGEQPPALAAETEVSGSEQAEANENALATLVAAVQVPLEPAAPVEVAASESKASDSLLPPTAETKVSGSLLPPTAETKVSGSLPPPTAETEVSGSFVPPAAETKVSGSLVSPITETEVSGSEEPAFAAQALRTSAPPDLRTFAPPDPRTPERPESAKPVDGAATSLPIDVKTLPAARQFAVALHSAEIASHEADVAALASAREANTQQLVQAMRVTGRGTAWEAVVHIRPEHLGPVTLSVRVEGTSVSATVDADAAAVRQWLETQRDDVRARLEEHGLELDQFIVRRDGDEQGGREQGDERPRKRSSRNAPAGDTPRFEITV
ncbi:MAG: flagellar hook-length control protein FliK [Vicinamibacterales bacterium]